MTQRWSSATKADRLIEPAAERVLSVALRWSDMDVYHHVNNVEFFRLIEEARARLFLATPGAPSILERGLVVASQQLDYINPLKYRTEHVSVGLTTTAIGKSSMRMRSRIFDAVPGGNELVYATGEMTLVGYSPALCESRPWEPDERAWFQTLA